METTNESKQNGTRQTKEVEISQLQAEINSIKSLVQDLNLNSSQLKNFYAPVSLELKNWLCRRGIHHHDFHISYRMSSDKPSAERLTNALELESIYGRPIHCFLQDKCMNAGSDWDYDFQASVRSARVCVVLVSEPMLEKMFLAAQVPDNVLLEIELALLNNISVFPLFMATENPQEGIYKRFNMESINNLPDNFHCHEMSPKNFTVKKVMTKLFKQVGKEWIDLHNSESVTGELMRTLIRVATPVISLWRCRLNTEFHEFFISYRADGTDTVAARYLALSLESELGGHRVFLDRRCINTGENWLDDGFVQGLISTRVVILFISDSALKGMKKKISGTGQEISIKNNNLLLEWQIAYALHKQGLISVFPIFLGVENGVTMDRFDSFSCDGFSNVPHHHDRFPIGDQNVCDFIADLFRLDGRHSFLSTIDELVPSLMYTMNRSKLWKDVHASRIDWLQAVKSDSK